MVDLESLLSVVLDELSDWTNVLTGVFSEMGKLKQHK